MSIDVTDGFPSKSGAGVALRAPYRRLGASTIVVLSGELDLATAPRLRNVLLRAIEAGGATPLLTVDLAGVAFIDSWGFLPIAEAVSRVRDRGGDLRIVAPRAQARRLLDLLGWTDLIGASDAASS